MNRMLVQIKQFIYSVIRKFKVDGDLTSLLPYLLLELLLHESLTNCLRQPHSSSKAASKSDSVSAVTTRVVLLVGAYL
jgi:hypothetical protein